jgi:hypothetical protein
MLKINQNLCKLIQIYLRLHVYTNYTQNCKITQARHGDNTSTWG